jgi:hypothetical protein
MKNANSIRSLTTSFLIGTYTEKRGKIYYCKICKSEIGIHKSEIRRHFIRNHYEIYKKTRDFIMGGK